MRRPLIATTLFAVCFILAGCGKPLVTNSGQASLPPASVPGTGGASIVPSADAQGSLPPVSASTEVLPAPSENNQPVPSTDATTSDVAEPSAPAPTPAVTPTTDPAFAGVGLPPASERWRYIQLNRQVFDGIKTYTTASPQILWWYDPIFGQPVQLGEINGDFPVQATFRFRGQEANAYEIPYQVNQSFGIKLPDAILTRMRNAGVGEWTETFIYAKSDIRARE